MDNVMFAVVLLVMTEVARATNSSICTGPAWSCRNKCEHHDVFPCSCKSTCVQFQICCGDYDDYCTDIDYSFDKSTPTYLEVSSNRSMELVPEDKKIAAYCSPLVNGWLEGGCKNQSDMENYNRCVQPDNTVMDDLIPVTDITTKIHYKNRFCALCDGATPVSWMSSDECNNHSGTDLSECIIEMKNTIEDQPVPCIPIMNHVINRTVALEIGLTHDQINDLEEKCTRFTSYVMDSNSGQIYRNRFCYLLDWHDNDTVCIPPPMNIEEQYCYANRNEDMNQCMMSVCTKQPGSGSLYCRNESLQLTMNMLFAVGNTDDLDITEDENELLLESSNILGDDIIEAFTSDANSPVACISDQQTSDDIDVRGFTRNKLVSLKCSIVVNDSLSSSDLLDIISKGIKKNDNKVKVPMMVEIIVCFWRTTPYRKSSSYCSRTSFDITLMRVIDAKPIDLEGYISIVCCMMSALGLIIRIALQPVVPYFQTLPGKVQFCLCCTLFVAYTSFLVGGVVKIGMIQCYIAAVVTHWSFLSSLFWMNVIAFQIWRTFRVWHHQVAYKHLRVLITSGIYAMGIPTIVISTGLTIEFVYPKSSLSPAYGKYSCWMNKSYSILAWFVIPCCSLSFVNTIFAILTFHGLRKQRTLDGSNSSHKITTVNDFAVSVRIVILVGVTWLLGLFAAFLGSPVTWMIFTIFNASLGFLISVVLVCNKRVFTLLKNKCLCPGLDSFTSITANTSQGGSLPT